MHDVGFKLQNVKDWVAVLVCYRTEVVKEKKPEWNKNAF